MDGRLLNILDGRNLTDVLDAAYLYGLRLFGNDFRAAGDIFGSRYRISENGIGTVFVFAGFNNGCRRAVVYGLDFAVGGFNNIFFCRAVANAVVIVAAGIIIAAIDNGRFLFAVGRAGGG